MSDATCYGSELSSWKARGSLETLRVALLVEELEVVVLVKLVDEVDETLANCQIFEDRVSGWNNSNYYGL